jgi:hypothetical protein
MKKVICLMLLMGLSGFGFPQFVPMLLNFPGNDHQRI